MCEYLKLKTEIWNLYVKCLKFEMSEFGCVDVRILEVENWKLKCKNTKSWKLKLKCLSTKNWKLKCLNTENWNVWILKTKNV
jgi:hypothetical protein